MQIPSEPPTHGPEEVQLLKLLRDLQQVLDNAITSLGGKPQPTPESGYLGSASAVFVNRAADGYVCLREAMRVAASKLLVRPAIEAVFSAVAVMKRRGFLFRKAYTEWLEETKMFANDAESKATANQDLEDVKRVFQQEPNYPIQCERVSARQTAEVAGMLPIYDEAYRTYCQFTHGALRAVQGHLDEATDTRDTQIMACCVLITLELLKEHTPANIPHLEPFQKRLEALQQRKS